MDLQLADEEKNVLTDVLGTALGNLREEIHRTATFELREQLKKREAVINAVLSKLRGSG
jgi:hypothetical protein